MKHVLIMGRPGIGKTVLLKRLAQILRHGPIDGFLTEECREGAERVGFWLSPLDGRQILLAHRRMAEGSRIGLYRVNPSVLDEVALGVIRRGVIRARVLFLDELNRMALSSAALTRAVQDAFDRGPTVVATAGVAPLAFLTALKQRRDVELIPLSSANREAVAEELTARLRAVCADDEAVQSVQRQADRICEMIVSGEVPQLDIEIQQAALRDQIVSLLPDQPALYQLVYETRFRRLWQQFRTVH